MKVKDLKKFVDRLVETGNGDLDLRTYDDLDDSFDIEFIWGHEDGDGEPVVGVRTARPRSREIDGEPGPGSW